MHDGRLSVDVDVYKIGNPDMYGANALAWYKGDGDLAAYAKDTSLSANLDALSKAGWYTTNIRHLTPKS